MTLDFHQDHKEQSGPDGIMFYQGAKWQRIPPDPDKPDSDCNDFRWAIDFEGKEVYHRAVELDEPFGSKLTFEVTGLSGAVLFTPDCFLSVDQLEKKVNDAEASGGEKWDSIGSVALGIGLKVPLSQLGADISGSYGNYHLTDSASYLVIIANTGSPTPDAHDVDANYYEHLVKGAKHNCKRISFRGTDTKPQKVDCSNPISLYVLHALDFKAVKSAEKLSSPAVQNYIPNAICFTATTGLSPLGSGATPPH
jgi:hypothetical protein